MGETNMDNLEHDEFGHWANRHDDALHDTDERYHIPYPGCKWCGTHIQWREISHKRWIAYRNGEPHVCAERDEAQRQAMVALLPDITDDV